MHHYIRTIAKKTSVFVVLMTFSSLAFSQADVKGNVSIGPQTPIDQGLVVLYQQDTSNEFTQVAEDTIKFFDEGFFALENIQDSGVYLLKAKLDTHSTYYEDYFPTYYGDTLFWKDADTLQLSGDSGLRSVTINLVEGVGQSGNGTISGQVIEAGPGKRKGPGDPQGGVEVLAIGSNDDPFGYDETDSAGNYKIDSLPNGQYNVRTEIAGFQATEISVSIDQNNQTADSTDFSVDKEEGKVGPTTYLTFTDERQDLQLYPNPADHRITVEISDQANANRLNLEVLNMAGQKIITQSFIQGKNQMKLKVNQLNKGVYMVELKDSNQSVLGTGKIMIY